jgi:AcrR family transcriptional regulator
MNSQAKPEKRPYGLGKRLEQMEQNRAVILTAARELVATRGYQRFTLDSLAEKSWVTRQTIHNLFGTKAGVLGALFDLIALEGGIERMAQVMSQPSVEGLIEGFVAIFCGFWSRERPLLRQIHAIGVIDPDFGALLDERNRRRHAAATRLVIRLAGARKQSPDAAIAARQAAKLTALTSFELFDSLAELLGNDADASSEVLSLVNKILE